MSSLPTWVGEDLRAFFKILFPTYEVKPYKLEILQTSLNVKQIEEIGQELELQKSIKNKVQYVETSNSTQKLNVVFQQTRIEIKHVNEPRANQKLKLGNCENQI